MALYKSTFRKKTKSAAKPAYKRKSYTRKKPTVTTVKKIVKKAIANNVENKTTQYYNTGADIYPSSNASFLGSILPVSPYASYLGITQGTNQQSRVGNRIKIRNCWIQGTIHAKPYNATTNPTPAPLHVIMWVLYDKTAPTSIPGPTTDFLQLGSSTSALQNDLMDQWAPVNTDKYRVLTKRIFKIGYAENTGTGSVVGQAYLANNDFKFSQNFKIYLTKYLVKNVRYNDNNATPTTRGLFLMTTVVQANGTNYNTSVVPAEMQYVMNLDYEDA